MKEKPPVLREQVYAWELHLELLQNSGVFYSNQLLTLDECRAIAVDACTLCQLPPPYHVGDSLERSAECEHVTRSLYFPEWSRQAAIVLHEVAHLVTRHGHDTVFVQKYIDLLEAFSVRPRWVLEASAEEFGLLVGEQNPER